jgi:hypothetical protein
MIRLVRQVLQGEQSPLTPRQVVSTREKTCPFVGGRQIHVQENINIRVEGRHCWEYTRTSQSDYQSKRNEIR